MNEAKQFTCLECGKSYKRYSDLRRHVSHAHPEKLNVIAPKLTSLKVYKYKCEFCDRKYNHINDINYHKRQAHGFGYYRNTYRIKCPLCEFSGCYKKFLYDHLESQHKIILSSEEIECDSFQAFLDWKQQIENNTLARYVKEFCSSMRDGKMNYFYKCHRSGCFVSQGKGLRQIKRQGSSKIGGACPASIKVIRAADDKCKIKYISTHVGHDIDIRHLYLTESERICLAGEIAQNIPYDEILKKVKDIAANSKFERIHLITRKDLHNIAQATKLCSDFIKNVNDVSIVEHILGETDSEQFLQEEETEEEQVITDEENVILDETGVRVLVDEKMVDGHIFLLNKLDRKENGGRSNVDKRKEEIKQNFMELRNSKSSQLKVLKPQSLGVEETVAAVGSSCGHRPVNKYIPPPRKKNIKTYKRLFCTRDVTDNGVLSAKNLQD